jgi:hypothetical protein
MYPEIKKFSLIDEDAPASITSSDTIPMRSSAGVNYLYVIETWNCLDCKYEGNNDTFIYKSRVISFTENTHSSETTLHCPECDSQNIKRPEPPKIVFYGDEAKLD